MNLERKTNHRITFGFNLLLIFCAILLAYPIFKSTFFSESGNESGIPGEDLKEDKEKSSLEPGLQFRRLQLQDENGVIDPNGLRKAKEHIEKMKQVQAERSQNREDQIQEAGIARDSWTWLGPGNIGGRIRTIAIQPGNANNMFVGSVSGGIWRTGNAGATWFPVNDFMANLAVTTIVINPADNNIMYAGTGEGFGNGDALQGGGIFRSGDQGVTWTQLATTNNGNFNFVNRIAVSPDGATLLAATNVGIWRSTDSGANWFLRTFNQALDVDFHPTDSTRAVVGELGNAIFSTNGGQTWSATATVTFTPAIANGGTPQTDARVELAYSPNAPLTVYAGVNQNSGEVYRSIDGGQNYTRVSTGTNYMGNQGWYNNAVWVNPQNSNFVVVGGIHLWRSTDGGVTLTQISNGSTNSAHADHHAIVSHPGFDNNNNRTVFFGNDGGIHRTGNVATVSNTNGWTELNNELGITQFYGAAGAVNGVIVGGTQDNGTLRFSGGTESWTSTAGGDGGFVSADQTDSNFFYGETQNLGVFRSSDGGQTVAAINVGIGDAPPNCGAPMQPVCQTNFIAPLTLDPVAPNTLLAGGWSLWRTNDARGTTPTWTVIKVPNGALPPPPGQTDPRPISAITVSPGSSSFILVGHNNGNVFRTFNGNSTTPTWTQVGLALPQRFVTRLVIDNSRNPNWIYATFGGFNGDNVYRSTDLGASWADITGNGTTGLPNVPVRSLVIHPHNRNLLYVGTEIGIFTSDDAGATWDLANGGPANVSVDELFWMGGDLVAATHGRGLYRASGGIYVDCNYTGVQFGTFTQPFRTVNAAISALPANRYTSIWLKPCNYNEQINTLNNPMKKFELRNLGGIATVGTP